MTETETARHAPPTGKPVCCGHRGYKSKFPENTLLSFNSAVDEANVRIVETDLQVTKDGVIVINHDPKTERVYGVDYTIRQTNYDPELKLLKNLQPPHESMLTFRKALQWLSKKNSEVGNVKFMLDIKRGNTVDILDKIVEDLLGVNPEITYWYDKIIFGIWTLDFYEYGVENNLLNNFAIVNITVSMKIAQQLMDKSLEYEKDPNFTAPLTGVSIIHFETWNANYDDTFIKFYEMLVNKMNRQLYLWTVNSVAQCEFYYDLGVTGFLTDIPDKLNEMMSSRNASRVSNLYEFYRYNDPINFNTKQGLKNYALYKVFKSFELAMLNGYLSKKVPIIGGGKNTVASYSLGIMRFLGIV